MLADWPRQADSVTVITLQNLRVSSVGFAANEADLRTVLGISP